MPHTSQFIEDAVAGGCDEALQSLTFLNTATELSLVLNRVKALLLSPEAWQAVGKTRGCPNPKCDGDFRRPACGTCGGWKGNPWRGWWHTFIDHLADGKTIEEALAAIAN